MLAAAFLICGHLYGRELQRRGLDPGLAGVVVFWAVIGGVVGARLYYLVDTWQTVREDWFAAVFSGSGLVWYGGLAGGLIACMLAVRWHGAPVIKLLDAVAPFLALGYGIGRIGCFLAGDGDYGPPTSLPWGMAFPNGVVPTEPGVRHHPTPLYELGLALAIFGLLFKLRARPRPSGWLFALFLCLQGAERVFIERWRRNGEVVWGLSEAQLIGLACLSAGLLWLVRLRLQARAARELPSASH
jgi:phosphatidylglycerol:prolipoprotein diacylglycerol transferase